MRSAILNLISFFFNYLYIDLLTLSSIPGSMDTLVFTQVNQFFVYSNVRYSSHGVVLRNKEFELLVHYLTSVGEMLMDIENVFCRPMPHYRIRWVLLMF